MSDEHVILIVHSTEQVRRACKKGWKYLGLFDDGFHLSGPLSLITGDD